MSKKFRDLVKNVNKSIHGLNLSDVCPIDRQNFKSFQKITDKRVTAALKSNMKDSEATIKYLELCCDITSSFLDFNQKPLERLFAMYRPLYFLRIWRNWIKSSRSYTLKNNFISHNAYKCIEMNAFHMVRLMREFRDTSLPHLFLPTIFDSQTCEKTFRQLRSMGTMDFTRINFSTFDLIHMIGRIEAQNDIMYFKLADGKVSFPLSHQRAKKTQIFELPSEDDINSTLEEAKKDAIEDARIFGMGSDNIDTHEFQSNLFVVTENEIDIEDENETDENFSEKGGFFNEMLDNEDDYEEDEQLNEKFESNSAFTKVVDESGETRIIRKSTLVWMLTEPGVVLSKDRLRRVQVSKKRKAQP